MNLNAVSKLPSQSLLLGLALISTASAADKDLLDLMTTLITRADLESRLVEAGNFREAAKGRFPLKGFDAFGLQFHGAVVKNDHAVETISVSCADADLSPAEAARVSAKVEEAISRSLGGGREVNDIPNHEDATDVKSRGRLWSAPQGDVVLLDTDDYTNRANFSVVRYFDSFPLAETGEAKEFWHEHLKAIKPPNDETEADLEWLAKHSAGVVLKQRLEGKLSYPGGLIYQGNWLPLEQDPPFYEHQIKAGNTPIILGQMDNRHRLQRYICAVRTDGKELKIEHLISVESTRAAGSGGFVFVADGGSIARFGIIVPVVAEIPAGYTRESDPVRTAILIHQQGRFEEGISPEDVPIQEILPAWKVLMRTGALPYKADPAPSKARIIWYRVEPSGEIKREE